MSILLPPAKLETPLLCCYETTHLARSSKWGNRPEAAAVSNLTSLNYILAALNVIPNCLLLLSHEYSDIAITLNLYIASLLFPMARSVATTATKEAKPQPASPADDDKTDFFWTYTEEPHRTRRLAIIKAHPEARPLVTIPLLLKPLTRFRTGPQAMRP